jgi:hypothetical protein
MDVTFERFNLNARSNVHDFPKVYLEVQQCSDLVTKS